MDGAELHRLIDGIMVVPVDCGDGERLQVLLGDVRRLRSWCQGREVWAAQQLKEVSAVPENDLAAGSDSDLTEAIKVSERADTVDHIPGLAVALDGGEVSGEHVDVVTRALRDLEPGERVLLLAEAGRLVNWARTSTVASFAKRVRALVRRLQADGGDGVLARQQAAVRLRMWIDPDSGMGCLRGEFDPLTYAKLHRQITNTVNRLYAETTPANAPSHPMARQSFLNGLALAAMLSGQTGGVGRPELIVVVDATNPDSPPAVDWGLPVEIPERVLFDLAGQAQIC